MNENGFTLELDIYNVYNIEPCPKCGSTKFAHLSQWRIYEICCDKCDYVPKEQGGVMLNCEISKKDVKAHAKVTKNLFQLWNNAIAKEKGENPKIIRTRINNK